jgi:hypothetical protein
VNFSVEEFEKCFEYYEDCLFLETKDIKEIEEMLKISVLKVSVHGYELYTSPQAN